MTPPAAERLPGYGVAGTYVVASPALYWAPMTVTDAELLLQSLAIPLLNTVMAQAREHHRLPSSWTSLLAGLRLWQLWDLDLPLSNWRKEILNWLYHELPRSAREQSVMLPARYAELCAAHTLWLPAPIQIGVPLVCTEVDRQAWYFATRGTRITDLHLNSFAAPTAGTYIEPFMQGATPREQTVMLATLIEYAVATYGHERLPILMAALPHHKSWETLLPAVYGVSVREFETGWQSYLLTHYGQ